MSDHRSTAGRRDKPAASPASSARVNPQLPRDTSLEAAAVRRRILRRMTLDQKAAQISELSETLRDTMIAGVRFRHPEYTEAEARWAAVRHLLGDELFVAAYPDAPLRAFAWEERGT